MEKLLSSLCTLFATHFATFYFTILHSACVADPPNMCYFFLDLRAFAPAGTMSMEPGRRVFLETGVPPVIGKEGSCPISEKAAFLAAFFLREVFQADKNKTKEE